MPSGFLEAWCTKAKKHHFSRNECFLSVPPKAARQKNHTLLEDACFLWPWYPRLQKTTWPTKTLRDPFDFGDAIRAGILILIPGLWPSPGPCPSSQTKGIRISFWPLGGQKIILIHCVWLLGPGPGVGHRPGIRIRIHSLMVSSKSGWDSPS